MHRRRKQLPLAVACVALWFGLVGCSRPDTKNMQTLLDKLSHGPEAAVGGLIYGYSQAAPGTQQVLMGMVRPLRAPSPDKHMSIEASLRAGRFTMLSVRVPWPQPTQGYGFQASFQPVLVYHQDGSDLLAGYVLPFNDIFHHFAGADMESITELSQWWVEGYGKR